MQRVEQLSLPQVPHLEESGVQGMLRRLLSECYDGAVVLPHGRQQAVSRQVYKNLTVEGRHVQLACIYSGRSGSVGAREVELAAAVRR